MENENYQEYKSYEEARNHFIDRVKERYGILMTYPEYDEICSLDYVQENLKGFFKKGSSKTIGIVSFKETKIWVLYNPKMKYYSTAFPPDVETDLDSMMYACFGRRQKHLAIMVYNLLVEEVSKERIDFPDCKEAGKYYYFNSPYSTLMMMKYKSGTIPLNLYIRTINKILNGSHPKIELSLRKKIIPEKFD